MAGRESSFQGTLDHDATPNLRRYNPDSEVAFVLQIRKFVNDENGNIEREYNADGLQEWILPEFEFGSYRHRKFITRYLRQAGINDPDLGTRLDEFFSEAKLMLEIGKENRFESRDNIPTFKFCVNKFEVSEDYLEARALELSMQEEAPKLLPATKESIQALQKVKLEGASTEECMICTEQLSSGTDQVVTSMPCSHLFHGHCLEKWLNMSHQCPLCRFSMPNE
ncbi:hypothetical protein REPUB_Repub17cG0124100 [Reevesia pubescens]